MSPCTWTPAMTTAPVGRPSPSTASAGRSPTAASPRRFRSANDGWSSGPSAPRGALLYPRLSWEGFEGISLGLMADLEPKGEGDKSMPENQWPGPGVGGGALGDPRDMAKAGLPEAQSPEDASSHPPERRLKPVPALRRIRLVVRRTLRSQERCPARAFKEMSGTPTSRCTV